MLKSENIVLIIHVLNLLIEFLNYKYTLIIKTTWGAYYLGGWFSIRGKGLGILWDVITGVISSFC